jgi:hypothetical protein
LSEEAIDVIVGRPRPKNRPPLSQLVVRLNQNVKPAANRKGS